LHYGTPVSQDFDPRKHLEKDMYIDELTGEKNAKDTQNPGYLSIFANPFFSGQMNWLLSKVFLTGSSFIFTSLSFRK
jgi:hypothetical protein